MITTRRRGADRIPSRDERRRHPRVQIVGRLDGALTPLALPFTVKNISEGGFLVEDSPLVLPVGSVHECLFMGDDLRLIVLNVEVMHARMVTQPNAASFVLGFRFLDRGLPEADALIKELVLMANMAWM